MINPFKNFERIEEERKYTESEYVELQKALLDNIRINRTLREMKYWLKFTIFSTIYLLIIFIFWILF